MNDTISRKAAIDALKEHRALYCDNTPDAFSKLSYAEKSRVDELDTAIATLVNLPPAQPEPHIGHWEPVGVAEVVGGESAMWGSAISYHKCSECGEQALEEDGEEKLSDFCPHCGARMEVYHEW